MGRSKKRSQKSSASGGAARHDAAAKGKRGKVSFVDQQQSDAAIKKILDSKWAGIGEAQTQLDSILKWEETYANPDDQENEAMADEGVEAEKDKLLNYIADYNKNKAALAKLKNHPKVAPKKARKDPYKARINPMGVPLSSTGSDLSEPVSNPSEIFGRPHEIEHRSSSKKGKEKAKAAQPVKKGKEPARPSSSGKQPQHAVHTGSGQESGLSEALSNPSEVLGKPHEIEKMFSKKKRGIEKAQNTQSSKKGREPARPSGSRHKPQPSGRAGSSQGSGLSDPVSNPSEVFGRPHEVEQRISGGGNKQKAKATKAPKPSNGSAKPGSSREKSQPAAEPSTTQGRGSGPGNLTQAHPVEVTYPELLYHEPSIIYPLDSPEAGQVNETGSNGLGPTAEGEDISMPDASSQGGSNRSMPDVSLPDATPEPDVEPEDKEVDDEGDMLLTPERFQILTHGTSEIKVVGWRAMGHGKQVIVQYGPKKCARYRLEPASAVSCIWSESNPEIIDIAKTKRGNDPNWGEGKVLGIGGVAWKCNDDEEVDPLYFMDPSIKASRERYPQTLSRVKWSDHEWTWEVRDVVRKNYCNRSKDADLAILRQARYQEKRYQEYLDGEREEMEESATPEPETAAAFARSRRRTPAPTAAPVYAHHSSRLGAAPERRPKPTVRAPLGESMGGGNSRIKPTKRDLQEFQWLWKAMHDVDENEPLDAEQEADMMESWQVTQANRARVSRWNARVL